MTTNGHFLSKTDIVETTDEHGETHIFEKVDEYEIDGRRYALLIYQGDGSHDCGAAGDDHEHDYDEELIVMRIEMEDGDQVYEAIEDEAEFERVVKHIEQASLDDDEPYEFEIVEND